MEIEDPFLLSPTRSTQLPLCRAPFPSLRPSRSVPLPLARALNLHLAGIRDDALAHIHPSAHADKVVNTSASPTWQLPEYARAESSPGQGDAAAVSRRQKIVRHTLAARRSLMNSPD